MNTVSKYDVIIIGGGKAGKSLAVDLAQDGVTVALIERSPEMIGGSCINVACIPTKTLITSSRVARLARRAGEFGVHTGDVKVAWPEVRDRTQRVVSAMRQMNHKNLTAHPGLKLFIGSGRFVASKTVEVEDQNGKTQLLTAEKIFINTGTRPFTPVIPGLDSVRALNSESAQRLEELPSHLVIIGGSYVGLEFAQMFRGFGCRVTVLERGPQILKHEDRDVATTLEDLLRADGIELHLNALIQKVGRSGDGVAVAASISDKEHRFGGSHVFVAMGRIPNTEALNLSVAGVEVDNRGYVKVNDRLETSVDGIWALGDVNGGPQFTHASFDDYRIVKENVFRGGQRTTAGRLVPFTLFTEPELSRIGLTEKEAIANGHAIKVAKLPVSAIPRAKTMSETRGLIKAVVDSQTSKILGCAILSVEAGEMIGAVQMTMLAGLPYTALKDAVLSHPTMTEGFNNLFSSLSTKPA